MISTNTFLNTQLKVHLERQKTWETGDGPGPVKAQFLRARKKSLSFFKSLPGSADR